MKSPVIIAALAAATFLGGCATLVEGTDQSITVSSQPSAAICTLEREGSQIGAINPTPGTVQIEKSSEDITVLCSKEGYSDGMAVLSPDVEDMALGNVIFGGFIGGAIDAGSGALYIYPSSVTVTLPAE